MPNVQAPDGSVIQFPDSMSMDQIGAVMRQKFPPTPPPAPSLWQKAKDNFNANTQGAQPGDGAIVGALKDFGAGGGDVIRAMAHPLDTIHSMVTNPDPAMAAAAHLVGDDTAHNKVMATQYPTAARTLGQLGAGAVAGDVGGRIVSGISTALPRTLGKAALLGKTPADAYESALKPSTTIPQGQRAAIVQTALENEIPVSKVGLEDIGTAIDKLNQAIKDQIASDPNRPIDPNAVATRADLAKAKFAKQVNAGGDLAAIDASKQQFLQEQGATPGKPAPPMGAADAQEMKQGTYSVLRGKYGEQGSASVEAQKALARGLKEEIASQFPEISKLNADESRLLDLQPILERAVNRISNHQLIGIGTPVAGAAAKAVTGSGSVGAVAGVLKAVLDNPTVKSRLAIVVSKSSKVPISQAMSRVQAYSAGLGAYAGATPQTSGDQSQPE